LVRREISRRAAASGAELFVAEIPLLFESGQEGAYDATVAVVTPDERRRSWSAERGVEDGRHRAIESRQLTGDEKARRADFVVQNDGDLDKFRTQARELRDALLRGRTHGRGSREQEKGN
jgi:dephospho-CoA kinase